MNQFRLLSCHVMLFAMLCVGPSLARADQADDAKATGTTPAATATPAATTTASASSTPTPKYPPFADVIKDFETVDGLIKLHHKGNRLLAELTSSQLNRDFIVLISIARGIGQAADCWAA